MHWVDLKTLPFSSLSPNAKSKKAVELELVNEST